MQQRRFRPGDVLDDYCPRERRVTNHAIVAMIDDRIKQTRCVVCDAEHEYKEGKVPPQRRKRTQAALFTQVLDNLQAPQPAARLALPDTDPDHELTPDDVVASVSVIVSATSGNGHDEPAARQAARVIAGSAPPVVPPHALAVPIDEQAIPPLDEGPVRRSLIRATLPRPEGAPPVLTRAMPEFTIRQPTNARGGHHRPAAGRRRGGHQPQGQGSPGPMRFGRGGQGHDQGQGPQGQGQRSHGGRPHGANGGRPGGPRRGGKKR